MKTFLKFLMLAGLFLLFQDCKKSSSNDQTTTPVTIFSTDFTTTADLNIWTQSTGGTAVIDSGAVKFTNITECFSFETSTAIPIVFGKSYTFTITVKVNESHPGDPALCAGDFLLYIKQGTEYLVSESFGGHPEFSQQSFIFTPVKSNPILLQFLTGTTRGAWIDHIDIVQN